MLFILQFRFYILLLVATVYLMLISIAVYTRPAGDLRTYSGPIDGVSTQTCFQNYFLFMLSHVHLFMLGKIPTGDSMVT